MQRRKATVCFRIVRSIKPGPEHGTRLQSWCSGLLVERLGAGTSSPLATFALPKAVSHTKAGQASTNTKRWISKKKKRKTEIPTHIRTFVKGREAFASHMLTPCSSPLSYFGSFNNHPPQPNLSVVSTSNLGFPGQAHWIIGFGVNALWEDTNRLWLQFCLQRGLKCQV